jgi:hypothetical protein
MKMDALGSFGLSYRHYISLAQKRLVHNLDFYITIDASQRDNLVLMVA